MPRNQHNLRGWDPQFKKIRGKTPASSMCGHVFPFRIELIHPLPSYRFLDSDHLIESNQECD